MDIIEKYQHCSINQLVQLGVISQVAANEAYSSKEYLKYKDEHSSSPIRYFVEKGLIQTIPVDVNELIGMYIDKNKDDLLKFCMVTSNGRCNPSHVKEVIKQLIDKCTGPVEYQ